MRARTVLQQHRFIRHIPAFPCVSIIHAVVVCGEFKVATLVPVLDVARVVLNTSSSRDSDVVQ